MSTERRNTSFLSWMCRVLPCILMAAGMACAQNQAARQAPAKAAAKDKAAVKDEATANVLVFCDRTPGSLFWADTWRTVAQKTGDRLTFTTTVEDFTDRLDSGVWSYVMVLARWSSGTPPYASALHRYAEAHPGQRIEMYLWHDHGTQPDANTAVLASTAMVTWQCHQSVIGYASVSGSDPKAGNARAVAGYVFPDFRYQDADRRTQAPTVVGRLSEPPDGDAASLPGVIPADECQSQCVTSYREEINVCNAHHAYHLAACDDLYGPQEGDPGDPQKLAECIRTANEDHTNCTNAAVNRYSICLNKCATSTEDPPDPGGP